MELYSKGDRVLVSVRCAVKKWHGKLGTVRKASNPYQGSFVYSVQFDGEQKRTILFQDSLTPDCSE